MYEKSIPKVNNNQYGIYYTEPFSGNNTDKQNNPILQISKSLTLPNFKL